jgi:hypothetical protein
MRRTFFIVAAAVLIPAIVFAMGLGFNLGLGLGVSAGFSDLVATLTDVPEPTDTNGIVICADGATYATSNNAIKTVVDRANDAVVLTKKVAGSETELLNESVDVYGSELCPDPDIEDIDTATSYAISSITAADPPVMTVDTSGLTEKITASDDRDFTTWGNVNWAGYSGGVLADGTGKMQITLNGTNPCGASLDTSYFGSLTAGQLVYVSIDLWQGTTTNTSVQVLFVGDTVSVDTFTIGAGQATFTTALTVPANIINFRISVPNSDTGTLFVDDVSFKELPFVEGDGVALSTGEQLGADLLSGWDFNSGWAELSNTNIDDADSFTTSASGWGITRSVFFEVGKSYKFIIAGPDNCVAYAGTPASTRQEIGANGTYRFTCENSDQETLYLRNTAAGTTDITTLEVYEIIKVDGNIYPLDSPTGAAFPLLGADFSDTVQTAEDFTTYNETDVPGKVTVTADTITLTNGDRDEDYYVTRDLGADAIGDLNHWLDINVTALTDDNSSAFGFWAISNADDDLKDIDDSGGSYINLWANRQNATSIRFELYECDAGSITLLDSSNSANVNTESFFAINRTGTTMTVEIYSTAALRIAGGAGDVDTITGTVIDTKFRYVYGLASYNTGAAAKDISGTIKNLRINDIGTGYAAVATLGSFTSGDGITPKVDIEPENLVTNGDFSDVTKATAKSVVSITKANPGVVTFASGHGFVDGDIIYFDNLTGMTDLNGEYWKLRNNSGDTFELSDETIDAWDTSSLDTSSYAGAEGATADCAQLCTATGWTQGDGWQLDVDGAGALTGLMAVDGEQTSAPTNLYQSITTTAGIHNLIYSYVVHTGGFAWTFSPGTQTGITGSGTVVSYPDATGTQNLFLGATTSATIGTIGNVTVRKVSETYAHVSGEQGATTYLDSDVAAVAGARYEHAYTINDFVGGYMIPMSGTNTGNSRASDGSYTEDVVAVDTGNHKIYFNSSAVMDISYWSIKEVPSRELLVVKDDSALTVIYNGSRVGEATVSDASVVNRKRHYQTGDMGGTFTAERLKLGALLDNGTATASQLYKIITSEVNHFFTGSAADDYYVGDGEAFDENNTARAVNE